MSNGKTALIVVDVQNDFCPPNGSLAVSEGDKIISLINDMKKDVKWDLVVLTQDWHPADHVSFYENHKDEDGAALFTPLKLPDGSEQVMWPTHCVQVCFLHFIPTGLACITFMT